MGLASACFAVAACGGPEYDRVASSYAITGNWEISRPDGTSESGPVTSAVIEVGEIHDGRATMTFVGVCGDTTRCSTFTMQATVAGHEGDGTVFDVDGTVRLPEGAFVTDSDGDHDGNAAIDDSSIKVDLLAQSKDGSVFRASFVGGTSMPVR